MYKIVSLTRIRTGSRNVCLLMFNGECSVVEGTVVNNEGVAKVVPDAGAALRDCWCKTSNRNPTGTPPICSMVFLPRNSTSYSSLEVCYFFELI